MEALVPALLLGMLLMLTDPSPRVAIALARQHGAARTLPGILAVHAIGNALAAGAALWLLPMMTPEARRLMLALALLFAAVAQALPRRAPALPARPYRHPAAAGFLLLAGPVLGDSLQFATGALALQRGDAVSAWAGALTGVTLVHLCAIQLGDAAWGRIAGLAARVGIAIPLLIFATVTGLAALRLI